MFIAIIGPRFSGKSSVESFLVSTKGFISLRLNPNHLENEVGGAEYKEGKGRSSWSDSSNTTRKDLSHFSLAPARNASKHLSFLSMSPLASPAPWSEDALEPLSFSTPTSMLNYVTLNWRDNFVTVDLCTRDLIGIFLRRPFFMLISVNAPLLSRYSRSQKFQKQSLEDFVQEDDEIVFGSGRNGTTSTPSLRGLRDLIDVHIDNDFNNISELHDYLEGLNLLDSQHLRPGWDAYFMTLASLASRRSNCMKRRVGAVLVRDNRLLTTGYNGTSRGLKNCNEGGCNRCNGASPFNSPDECICLHAEENALLEAGQDRIGPNAVLYCNTCPCLRCTVKIIQMGIKTVVYNLSYKVDDASALLFQQAGVELRRFDPSQRLRLPTADDRLETRTLLLSPATTSDM